MADLDRFELFTYIAESGSITRTANKRGVSKASLSKQIKQLEKTYNIVLFTRYKQRLQLTPEGNILLEQCLRLRHELNGIRDMCDSLNQEPAGELHVVVFPYFANKLIIPKLKAFLTQHPKIKLQLDTTERIPNFIEENVDLSVGFSLPVPNPGEVIQKRMATTRYILCGSPSYLKAQGIPKNLDDLSQHQYIDHIGRSIHPALKLQKSYQMTLTPSLLLNSVSAMIECAKQGLGLIQLPLYMLDETLEQGALVEVLSDYQATNASVYYHYPKLRYMQPKVKKFIEFFLE